MIILAEKSACGYGPKSGMSACASVYHEQSRRRDCLHVGHTLNFHEQFLLVSILTWASIIFRHKSGHGQIIMKIQKSVDSYFWIRYITLLRRFGIQKSGILRQFRGLLFRFLFQKITLNFHILQWSNCNYEDLYESSNLMKYLSKLLCLRKTHISRDISMEICLLFFGLNENNVFTYANEGYAHLCIGAIIGVLVRCCIVYNMGGKQAACGGPIWRSWYCTTDRVATK